LLTSNSNRQLDNKFNIFQGIWRNWFFIAISLIMIGSQILIVFIGGRVFTVTRLDGAQWCISIVLGALSIPVGVLIRLIPDKLFPRRIWGFEGVRSAFARSIRRGAIDE
jgi:Ca2+-transporting ATPase